MPGGPRGEGGPGAIPPGQNKEVLDAEVYAIYQLLDIAGRRRECGCQYTIVVERIRSGGTRPVNALPWPPSGSAPGCGR